jgi:hypothetical protein
VRAVPGTMLTMAPVPRSDARVAKRPAERDFPEPVFVGGSARAGTHAVGRLVASHPRYHLLPVEVRFHAARDGLPDLLAGHVGVEDFVTRCQSYWWRSGLKRLRSGEGDREWLDATLKRFRADYERDPWDAARDLVRAVLDPEAERDGKPSWVEVTGPNIAAAPTLLRILPRARFINMVRDGRAVVASMLKKTGMTDDPLRALEIWERRVRSADAAMRAVGSGSAMVLSLDELVATDRERSFRRVIDFLEIEDETSMRRHFDDQVSAERAHFDRWRERMAPPDARRVDRHYRRVVRALRRDGIRWAPEPEPRGARLARAGPPVAGASRSRRP